MGQLLVCPHGVATHSRSQAVIQPAHSGTLGGMAGDTVCNWPPPPSRPSGRSLGWQMPNDASTMGMIGSTSTLQGTVTYRGAPDLRGTPGLRWLSLAPLADCQVGRCLAATAGRLSALHERFRQGAFRLQCWQRGCYVNAECAEDSGRRRRWHGTAVCTADIYCRAQVFSNRAINNAPGAKNLHEAAVRAALCGTSHAQLNPAAVTHSGSLWADTVQHRRT